MAKASQRISQPASANCPVVELAQKLLVLWDADDGSQREYLETKHLPERTKDDTLNQFGEWREAIETIISFSEPRGLQGALVQMAIALDTLRDVDSFLQEGKHDEIGPRILELDRILWSAVRTMQSALGSEIDPTVGSILKIYGASYDDRYPTWINSVQGWAERGRLDRASNGE